MADAVAAELAPIRERHVQHARLSGTCVYCAERWPCDAARLLAAVEAALARAAKWKRLSVPGDAQDECADDLRTVITRVLLGLEAGRD